MKNEWNWMSGEDTAIKIALDATEILARISKAMPDLQLDQPTGFLLARIQKVMESEGYEV